MRIALDHLTLYGFCDPAASPKKRQEAQLKRTRARSAIIVVAADELRRIFVVHAWAARCQSSELTVRIIETVAAWPIKVFGIEANAMQSLYAESVQRDARLAGYVLPLTSVTQPTGVDKDWRIRSTLQPVVAHGRLFLQPEQDELRAEIASFPSGATKDLIDALASAVALVPPAVARQDIDHEALALAKYLRDSGAPAHHIEERMFAYRERIDARVARR